MDNCSNLVHKSHSFGLEVLDDKVEMVDVAEAHNGHHPGGEGSRGREGVRKWRRNLGLRLAA